MPCRAACTLLTALSLLVCVLATGLWVRSHFVFEVVQRRGEPESGWDALYRHDLVFASARGRFAVVEETRLQLGSTPPPPTAASESRWERWRDEPAPLTSDNAAHYNWSPPVRLMVSHVADGGSGPSAVRQLRFLSIGGGMYVVSRAVVCPYWPVVLLTGVAPAVGVWRVVRRRRRARRGLCRECGYDLRASPHGCPECGASVGRRNGGTSAEDLDGSHPGPAGAGVRSGAAGESL
jgi:hypothetical protein